MAVRGERLDHRTCSVVCGRWVSSAQYLVHRWVMCGMDRVTGWPKQGGSFLRIQLHTVFQSEYVQKIFFISKCSETHCQLIFGAKLTTILKIARNSTPGLRLKSGWLVSFLGSSWQLLSETKQKESLDERQAESQSHVGGQVLDSQTANQFPPPHPRSQTDQSPNEMATFAESNLNQLGVIKSIQKCDQHKKSLYHITSTLGISSCREISQPLKDSMGVECRWNVKFRNADLLSM